MCTLQNKSEDLPVNFSFTKIPLFSTTPASGRLLPLQSMECRIAFCPKNLGEFRSQLELIGEDQTAIVQRVYVPVHGMALVYSQNEEARRKLIGGPTKLPSDFTYDFWLCNGSSIASFHVQVSH